MTRRDTIAMHTLQTLLAKPATEILNPYFVNRLLGRDVHMHLEQNDGERALVKYAVLIADMMNKELG